MVRSFVVAVARPPLSLARRSAADAVRPPLEAVQRRAAATALELLDALLASRLAEEAARRIVTSEVAEQAVSGAFEGPLVDAVTRRLLESEELWLLVQEVATSPAVTAAISRQGASFADEVADEVREQSQQADAWLERTARRMLRRSPAGPPAPATPLGVGPA
ncbi:hypothetical protein Q5424_02110 [Conexibacter sp. JD483]|uniref:hypothetical protein n=1 Tax=unclassified Conexibacter TaxID=2627773 RepID=UPI002722760C|nr:MULTISPECIES: hypothetical protein [unclassified Conexibacter]MDO8185623.1 hypothetical protein [Conexibacter sp. CPCC 205706]MDO8198796.1 hypothetical protein [Conexibacter sp. CPCC 205762]MDR9367854.1 hypothetical protein [Conexibacter sp. JD483]